MNRLRIRRGLSGPGGLALATLVSAALHGAVLAALPQEPLAPAGQEAAGAGGEAFESLIALTALPVDLAPPDPVVPDPVLPAPELTLPLAPPQIEGPRVALPAPLRLPPEPPRIAPERPQTEARPRARPIGKPTAEPAPKRAETAPQPHESRAASTAAGAGGSPQAGAAKTPRQAALTSGAETSALGAWGAAIRARVERRKSLPAGTRAAGTVGLTLSVDRAGGLVSASVARSSGDAALDAAALAAVRKAGRFPAAPAELTGARYSFGLAIKFAR